MPIAARNRLMVETVSRFCREGSAPDQGQEGVRLGTRVCPHTLSKKSLREVSEELEAEFSEDDALTFRSRYNAAPSKTLWILRPEVDRRVIDHR